MPSILFFDDYPNASETQLFRDLLRDHLPRHALRLDEARTVLHFEELARTHSYDYVILDVMAQSSIPITWTHSTHEVPSTLTGVELLRRCRMGKYGKHYHDVPIYMRTARGEASIRRLCTEQGADGYFPVGRGDMSLINSITVHWGKKAVERAT